MKNNKSDFILLGIKILVSGGLLLVGWLLYDKLPDQMPTHWNIQGQADAYGTKLAGVLTIPLLILGLIILFWFLPKLDPKKENYEKFGKTWEIIQISIIGFLAYTQIISFIITLHPTYSISPFMFGGLGIFFIILGNFMGKIRSNYFIGIKTPWTIDNEEVWNKTTRLSGWLWVLGGLVFLIEAFVMKYLVAAFVIVMIGVVVVPIAYSYIVFRNVKK